MDVIDKLTTSFIKFPGIGPRQARRFVSFLLSAHPRYVAELAELIKSLENATKCCIGCGRHFVPKHSELRHCRVCADPNRMPETLMIVEKDIDVDHIDRAGAYRGTFFVLGGTMSLFEDQPSEQVRVKDLLATVETRAKTNGLREIIFALSTNVEGEETAAYLARRLAPLKEQYHLTLSMLGRGLSTGAEIEYADPETIKNALKNRESSK